MYQWIYRWTEGSSVSDLDLAIMVCVCVYVFVWVCGCACVRACVCVRRCLTNLIYVQVAKDNVHVLVDTTGYTMKYRAGFLALTKAPIVLSFHGFPGTMAAKFVHYLSVSMSDILVLGWDIILLC